MFAFFKDKNVRLMVSVAIKYIRGDFKESWGSSLLLILRIKNLRMILPEINLVWVPNQHLSII